MSLAARAASCGATPSTSRCRGGTSRGHGSLGGHGRSPSTCGSCVLGGIKSGYRRVDQSVPVSWRALPHASTTRVSAKANARLSDSCAECGMSRRLDGVFSQRASLSSAFSFRPHNCAATATHVTRAAASTGVETASADAADAAAAAAVASGYFQSLKSRELNEALQLLGKGPNWRLVFDVFDQLVELGGAEAGGKNGTSSLEGANAVLRGTNSGRPKLPNAHVATTVLSAAGRRGDLQTVRRVFAWMQKQGPGRSAPTAYTYTAYIQAVGGSGDWRDAFAVYRQMRQNKITPTSHTYSALINVGAKGGRVGASAAAALVEDMKQDRLVPDVPVASALICAYGVLGQFQNAERMLYAAESAVKQQRKGDASAKPDARLYTEFLIASCRCGRPEVAAAVFETENFPKTTYTCTAAIKAYGECDEWRKGEALYEQMTNGNSNKAIRATKITHTAMLSAYEKCGEWRRAKSLLAKLSAQPGQNLETHWNVTMSACGKAGEWVECEKLFNEMKKLGVPRSSVTFSVLISAYGTANEFDKANIRFKEMCDLGFTPDDYTFVGLMSAPASSGDLQTCLEIKKFMWTKHGVRPTVHVWNECIRAADASHNYEQAVSVYQNMIAVNIEPNYATRELLEKVGKNGVEYYEDKQAAANFGTLVASLVGVAGMMAGRW